MSERPLTKGALDYAFRRIEDFMMVHTPSTHEERVESVNVMHQGLGLDENVKAHLNDWIERFSPGEEGPIHLGLLVGLYVNQYNEDA